MLMSGDIKDELWPVSVCTTKYVCSVLPCPAFERAPQNVTFLTLLPSLQVCVVTGAARGLGNLFARTFAESGSNAIAILDLDQTQAETAAKDLTDWFEEHGQAKKGEIAAIGLGCDVGNEEAVQEAFKKIVHKFGRIDVLVTAAGIVGMFRQYASAPFDLPDTLTVVGLCRKLCSTRLPK